MRAEDEPLHGRGILSKSTSTELRLIVIGYLFTYIVAIRIVRYARPVQSDHPMEGEPFVEFAS